MKTTISLKNTKGDVFFTHTGLYNNIQATIKYANKYNVGLAGVDLHGRNLRKIVIKNADLSYANLKNADLKLAVLTGSDLSYANLSGANLKNAILKNVNLTNANLKNVKLLGADLYNANITDAVNLPYVPFDCPIKGSFLAYKRVYDYIITLEIPEDAMRSSATRKLCRCDKAKVIYIDSIKDKIAIDSVVNKKYIFCEYKVGEMVYADSFDKNRWHESSHGIHFFMKKDDAIACEK